MSVLELIWRYRVRAECVHEFERIYGADGDWARLFRSGEGYLGTQLYRDCADPLEYLTVDRWVDAATRERWMHEHTGAYAALDARCAPLTEQDVPLRASP